VAGWPAASQINNLRKCKRMSRRDVIGGPRVGECNTAIADEARARAPRGCRC
jgi:hypothetical protein